MKGQSATHPLFIYTSEVKLAKIFIFFCNQLAVIVLVTLIKLFCQNSSLSTMAPPKKKKKKVFFSFATRVQIWKVTHHYIFHIIWHPSYPLSILSLFLLKSIINQGEISNVSSEIVKVPPMGAQIKATLPPSSSSRNQPLLGHL